MSIIINGKHVAIQGEDAVRASYGDKSQAVSTADMTITQLYEYFESVRRRKENRKAVAAANPAATEKENLEEKE